MRGYQVGNSLALTRYKFVKTELGFGFVAGFLERNKGKSVFGVTGEMGVCLLVPAIRSRARLAQGVARNSETLQVFGLQSLGYAARFCSSWHRLSLDDLDR